MKYAKVFLLLIVLTGINSAIAQDKYAFVVGIDKYTPPADYKPTSTAGRLSFSDLEGCKNDAQSIISIVNSKFFFPIQNIDTLFDENATRDNILKGFDRLLNKAKKGDVAFIYYAGHGSQVKNSLSSEGDGEDESFVPSDTWKQGVSDIRDKEFAKVCNAFLDKGVKLTVILDCCHSGSLSRGPVVPGKFRYIAGMDVDAKDASKPVPPETRNGDNYLIFSAAQDNQFAQEQTDDNNMPHGAFTLAFIAALNQQSVDASAVNLFAAVRAILKSNGKKQEPVLGGSSARQQQTLFGLSRGSVPDKSLVAIIKADGSAQVELQGGIALGINKDNELRKVYNKTDTVVLRVDSVLGVNRSTATVIRGDAKKVKAGELFEVSNWVSSKSPLIRLYIPAENYSISDLKKITAFEAKMISAKKITVVNDLEKYSPQVSVYFSNGKCFVNRDGKSTELPGFDENAIAGLLKNKDTVYFEMPATKEVSDALRQRLGGLKTVKLAKNANDAQYVLYGIHEGDDFSYGLRRLQVAAADSLESMPLRTKEFSSGDNSPEKINALADNIYEYTLRLSKLRGWLNLTGPADAKSTFPFHIELINSDTKKRILLPEYKLDQNVSLHLVTDPDYKKYVINQKYIYVFAIDKNGKMTLGFPGEGEGNAENKFPHTTAQGNVVEDVKLFDYQVSEPAGTDNIYLLASDQPIQSYALYFNQDGVRGVNADNNPLSSLLNMGNESTARSGFDRKMPSTWSLMRLSMKSKR